MQRSASKAKIAWWLCDGTEECRHCGRMYLYEVEIRCHHCDGPGCPHCTVVHRQGYIVCPECAPPYAATEN